MDITAVKAVSVKPGDVLVLELDFGMMPPSRANVYAEQVKMEIQTNFPNNQIIVLPMHKARISVINVDDTPDATVTDVEYTEVVATQAV